MDLVLGGVGFSYLRKDGERPNTDADRPGDGGVGIVVEADIGHPIGTDPGEHGEREEGEKDENRPNRGLELSHLATVSKDDPAGDDEDHEAEARDENDVEKGQGVVGEDGHEGVAEGDGGEGNLQSEGERTWNGFGLVEGQLVIEKQDHGSGAEAVAGSEKAKGFQGETGEDEGTAGEGKAGPAFPFRGEREGFGKILAIGESKKARKKKCPHTHHWQENKSLIKKQASQRSHPSGPDRRRRLENDLDRDSNEGAEHSEGRKQKSRRGIVSAGGRSKCHAGDESEKDSEKDHIAAQR